MSAAAPTPRPPAEQVAPNYRKGQVWMVAHDPERPAVGTEIWANRPGVIVSANQINDRSGFVTVVYLSSSTNKRTGPMHVPLPSPDGRGTTMALCEQLHTVDVSRLGRRLGKVDVAGIRSIDAAIAFSLSMGRNPDTFGLMKKWESHIKVHGIDMRAEIEALSKETSDERVAALLRALTLVTDQCNAYRQLLDTQGELPSALAQVEQIVKEISTDTDSEPHLKVAR